MGMTARMFWEHLHAGIVASGTVGKSVEQMKAECSGVIKKRIDDDIGDLKFPSEAYLHGIGISLVETDRLEFGKLVVDQRERTMTIHVGITTSREQRDEVIAHEVGHSYMYNRVTYKPYYKRDNPYIFNLIYNGDEYDKAKERFATEIGEYLLRVHGIERTQCRS